ILQLRDLSARVLLEHARRFVLVAAIAGVGLVLLRRRVAGGARNRLAPAVVDREPVREGRTAPGAGRMTLLTVRAAMPLVDRRLGVTGRTGLRRATVDVAGVAQLAIDLLMLARQFEGGQVMIKLGQARSAGCPGAGRVTLFTVRAEAALVDRWLGVAGHTPLG